MSKQGYITIATSAEKFMDYAVNLRLSCLFNDSRRKFAVVTDEPGMEIINKKNISRYFDHIILYKGRYSGLLTKLDLFGLSPFDEAFFIDSDSLMMKNPERAWRLVSGKNFVIQGKDGHFEGKWAGRTEEETKNAFGIGYVPRYNGGFVYFDKSDKAGQVFDTANKLVSKFKELGFYKVHEMPDEEPIISAAVAKCGLRPVPDSSNIMFSPIDKGRLFYMSVPGRMIIFRKHGKWVSPVILHCCAELRDSKHYARATRQLQRFVGEKLNA